MSYARDPATFRSLYGDLPNANPLWKGIAGAVGQVYDWPSSTYIAKPPFFDGFKMQPGTIDDIRGLRTLGIFGDSVTTDHISPAGSIKPTSPPASTCRKRTSRYRTSTATARGAATMK
jgi:aconitate hydratase